MSKVKEKLLSEFIRYFGPAEWIIQSPARVNIIGEHTDYNLGLSLPFAVNRYLWIFARKNDSGKINIIANDLNESFTINLDKPEFGSSGFERYFLSVLRSAGDNHLSLSGLDILFGGDIPIGAGMSSSSALTCGFVFLINEAFDLNISNDDMILWASIAENATGLEGGKMDQTTILKAKKDHALLLDFYYQSCVMVPLDLKDHHFLLLYSNIQHSLVDTEYNARREECKALLKIINQSRGLNINFRQLDQTMISEASFINKDTSFDKLSFVLAENVRVIKTVKCLKQGDFLKLGSILYDSHDGLSNIYQVSCPELDFIVHHTKEIDCVLGARMMGGGFGGCALTLIKGDFKPEIFHSIQTKYLKKFKRTLDLIPVGSSDGISVL